MKNLFKNCLKMKEYKKIKLSIILSPTFYLNKLFLLALKHINLINFNFLDNHSLMEINIKKI